MPEKGTIERARKKAREGKSASTQAGEFVREEIHHIREGKHGARSAKQAIAIGLSKARRAGVKLPPRKGDGKSPASSRRRTQNHPSPARSRATMKALRHEPISTVTHAALARQTHASALKRGRASLHQAAMKAVRTKGTAGLREAGKKAARTRIRDHRRAAA